jgi:phosphoribosylformimino-5-aminoimidazole carboxamide ribotide isomerase
VIVIPAVDIKGGRCVRLLQGRMDQETVFGDDPAAMASRWESLGAEWLHVVDLDGAVAKTARNFQAIERIVGRVRIPVQVGGGIRDAAAIDAYLSMGVSRVTVGTAAIRNPDFVAQSCRQFPGRIVVGIDARNGHVAVEGWTETTATTAVELARRFEDCGVAAITFTDIGRDGMQSGVNIEATRRLIEAVHVPVIASGGVATLADIQALLPLEALGLVGVITGRAIYSGSLDLQQAIALARGETRRPGRASQTEAAFAPAIDKGRIDT